MDPMDFTMDEAQAHHSPSAHRHQCQPSQPSNVNPFAPHTRDGHPYDPVYDSSSWYQANSVPSRAGYTAPDVHWGVNPYLPVPNWQGQVQGLPDGQHPGGQDPTGTFRPSRYMGGQPWNEMRPFDPSPFGFNSYGSPLNGNSNSSESASGGSTQTPSAAAGSPHVPSTYGQESHARSVWMNLFPTLLKALFVSEHLSPSVL
jgi:hypothetical protein